MDAELGERVARCTGAAPTASRAVESGYSRARRFVVRLSDGRTAFVKQAADDETDVALRAEHRIYARVRARFVPTLLGWDDEGEHPVLVIEDLSACAWPPPWSRRRVEGTLETLRELAATPPPPHLPLVGDDESLIRGWKTVAEDPVPFLRLGVAGPDWLEGSLPALLAAEAEAPLDGDAFLHFDVRSDNVCFRGDGAVLVDWNWSCIGNPAVDVAFWLPSLSVEGGPSPRELMPDEPALAAFVAGYFAARAGLPPLGDAPVRSVQLAQLRVALPWAAEAIGLERPQDRSSSR